MQQEEKAKKEVKEKLRTETEKLRKDMEEKLKIEVEKIRKEAEEEKALKVRKPLHHQGTKRLLQLTCQDFNSFCPSLPQDEMLILLFCCLCCFVAFYFDFVVNPSLPLTCVWF